MDKKYKPELRKRADELSQLKHDDVKYSRKLKETLEWLIEVSDGSLRDRFYIKLAIIVYRFDRRRRGFK